METTLLIPLLTTFLLGAVDYGLLSYQWGAATKAVAAGARLAAVSNPVASGLNALSTSVINVGTVNPGDPMPAFTITCSGSTASCTCAGAACAGATISYNATAMNTLVYGRTAGATSCQASATRYYAGMCNFLSGLTPSNVQVVYTQTGLGYVDRPDGPQPTVSVSLLQAPDAAAFKFQFFFLGSLLGLTNKTLGPFTTTVTGEALSSSAQ
ncbi:TadE/TadG family type IV pilus assembly protein [Methylobacterium nodulans]|uniref:TadE/TadG family type IV pilus assembly protein n=1 Tax=Methylobacterium nodulans TaxID=114616 RepID=UPI000303A7B6|nr:TadE/TadG family type IV pilus assembly protein [Methylobacterium nodulans]